MIQKLRGGRAGGTTILDRTYIYAKYIRIICLEKARAAAITAQRSRLRGSKRLFA